MASSMTGFGRAQRSTEHYAVELEIRSLNNRYTKVRLHLPGFVSMLEGEVENVVRSRISRGTVDVWLKVADVAPAESFTLDMDAVRRYREFASRLAAELDVKAKMELSDYLALPGVVYTGGEETSVAGGLRAVVMDLLDEALGSLEEMRRREGGALVDDIRERARVVSGLAKEIAACSGEVVKGYRDRLLARVNELLADSGVEIAQEGILREVSVFAERSDISEELARIESHLGQLEETLRAEGAVGRKLEFVAQEIHREINTVGAKANDAAIARLVVDAKGEIDRIRQQCQNLE